MSVLVGYITRPKVSLTPKYEAVRVTGVCTGTDWKKTLNAVDVAPAGIVTVGGTVAEPADEAKAIVAPEAGAGAVNATLHVDPAGGVTDIGRQVKPFKPGGCWIVTRAPLLEVNNDVPVESAASGFESWTAEAVFVVEGDTVRDTVATTPLEIAKEFRPQRTQCEAPGRRLQLIDLKAPTAIGPALTLADEKSTCE